MRTCYMQPFKFSFPFEKLLYSVMKFLFKVFCSYFEHSYFFSLRYHNLFCVFEAIYQDQMLFFRFFSISKVRFDIFSL